MAAIEWGITVLSGGSVEVAPAGVLDGGASLVGSGDEIYFLIS